MNAKKHLIGDFVSKHGFFCLFIYALYKDILIQLYKLI